MTPVFNPPLYALKECVESVLEQTFQDWELLLVDDCSSDTSVLDYLKSLSARDRRIRVTYRESNGGICKTSDEAVRLAVGDFIVLLDHDDYLERDALFLIFNVLEADEKIDYVYSDEDKVDSKGDHFDVFLKPDWSPERLRGQNYCCHLSVIRRSLLLDVGGFREGFEGAQDYDLVLRVTEKSRKIFHIPKVLYHWRAIPGSTAQSPDEKPYALYSARRALTDHLQRTNIQGEVVDAGFGYHRIIRELTIRPLVSIIMPTCGSERVIFGAKTCLVYNAIASIVNKSSYNNIEIILVADRHTPQTVIENVSNDFDVPITIIWYDKPFNFSEKCNLGFVHSKGDIVLFLNDDIEVISEDWLETLIGHAVESDCGLVGPLLLLEDGRIQSAGHSNTPSPHNFRNGHLAGQSGEFGVLAIARECSGVTGAAVMMRRDVFVEVGGFSVQFPNCFNDVDLAFKVLDRDYRIVWTPHARLYHLESASRNPTVDKRELDLLLDRWGRFFDQDRFCRLI